MSHHKKHVLSGAGALSTLHVRKIHGTRILLLLVLLSACTAPISTATTALPPTDPPATLTPTASPTITPTPTSIPKQFGICPAVQESLVPDFKRVFEEKNPYDFVTPVLAFLNQGGSPQAVVDAFQEAQFPIFEGDLTSDSVPELGVFDGFLTVLGCVDEKYEVLFEPNPEWYFGWNEIISTQDMNSNGVPDLVAYNPSSCGSMWNCSEAYIYEWDGQQFQNLVQSEDYDIITMLGAFDVEVMDVDENGTQELITKGGVASWIADYADGIPWREQSDTYMWDGQAFVLHQTEFAAPEYRFQAVQDGDRAALRGDYQQALNSYTRVISDNSLQWWTPERKDHEEAEFNATFDTTSTPVPHPTEDPTEKPSLAAYALYRIMLLYILQEQDMEAQSTYDTLVKRFPEGQAGHGYVELASVLWSEYQLHSDIALACSKAIEFAEIHEQEILTYLGNTDQSYYHGWQSLEYAPRDICPFESK